MWNTIKTHKKKVIIALLVLSAILVLVAKFLPSKEEPILSTSPSPVSTPFLKKPTGEKMSVSGVSVNNIYKKEININPRGDVLFGQTQDYQILYFSKEKQFLISIIGSPFNIKRTLAEQYFLDTLGIKKEDACRLNVVVSTPSFVNPNESGKNYKLSFCET